MRWQIAVPNDMQNIVKVSAAIASWALATSGFTVSYAASPSWCSSPKPFLGETQELPHVLIQRVSEEMMKSAFDMLKTRNLIPIGRATYSKLLEAETKVPTEQHLYLVRAGVMAPTFTSLTQLAQYIKLTAILASEGVKPRSVQVVSLITSDTPQYPTNIPVLIAAPTPISTVSAICIGGR